MGGGLFFFLSLGYVSRIVHIVGEGASGGMRSHPTHPRGLPREEQPTNGGTEPPAVELIEAYLAKNLGGSKTRSDVMKDIRLEYDVD